MAFETRIVRFSIVGLVCASTFALTNRVMSGGTSSDRDISTGFAPAATPIKATVENGMADFMFERPFSIDRVPPRAVRVTPATEIESFTDLPVPARSIDVGAEININASPRMAPLALAAPARIRSVGNARRVAPTHSDSIDGQASETWVPVISAAPGGDDGPRGVDPIVNLDTTETFVSIQDAILDPDTVDGHVIEVQTASHSEGLVLINKAVTIRGQAATNVVTATTDTGTSGDARGWFLGTVAGITIRDLTLDGDSEGGRSIYQVLRLKLGGTVENCTIRDVIGLPVGSYDGRAIAVQGPTTIRDCVMTNIRRIGIHIFGPATTGTLVERNTYTGKGAGDQLDYGIELGGGAVATLNQNTITACTGVAVVDGSTSAAVLITDFFAPGTAGTLSNNSLTGNTGAVSVGFLATDLSDLTAHDNDFSGNTDYGVGHSGEVLNTLDASANWWGSNTQSGVAAEAIGSPIDYSPWLNSGTDTNVAAGFQGDFSYLIVDDDSPQSGAIGRIQEGVDLVSGSTVNVLAGTYVEQVVISDPDLMLLGANAGADPRNGGARGPESIIYTDVSDPDPFVAPYPVLIYLNPGANNVTIDGFLLDGDNPLLPSGVTLNGADLDAEEAIASYEGVGDITVRNNIIRNTSYSGVDFYNYYNSGGATSDNVITHNLIQNIGAFGWGQGVLIYNNFYADVVENEITDVRVGVQTGNFHNANPGATASISNNEITARRLGIFYNLHYSSASPFTIMENDISGADNDVPVPVGARWSGMLISSQDTAVDADFVDNTISGGGLSVGYTSTAGYTAWNTPTTADLAVEGGTVSGVQYGVWVNNYEGYTSDANNTHLTIDGVTGTASDVGVYVYDSPSNTNGATVAANVTNDTGISAGPIGTGVKVEGADASAAITANDASINGNLIGIDVNGGNATISGNLIYDNGTGVRFTNAGTGSVTSNDFDDFDDNGTDLRLDASAGPVTIGASNNFAGDDYYIDLQGAAFYDLTGGSAQSYDESNNFRIEDRMYHKLDATASGRITWVTANRYVSTPGTGANDETIQRGIDAASLGDTVNVEPGSFPENLILAKQLTMKGAQSGVDARGRVVGAPNPTTESVVSPVGRALELQAGSGGSTIDGFTFMGNLNGAAGAVESTTGATDNLQILNNYIATGPGFAASALFLNKNSIDTTVDRNEFVAAAASTQAIFLDGADQFHGLHFTSNNVLRNGPIAGTGLFVDGNRNVGTSASLRTPLLEGNLIQGHALGLNGGSRSFRNADIIQNTFTGNTGGMAAGPLTSTIAGNTFALNSLYGLRLTSFGNTVDSTRGTQSTVVTNNNFAGNGTTVDLVNGYGDIRIDDQFNGTQSTNSITNNSLSSAVGAFNRESNAEVIDFSGNWWNTTSNPEFAGKILGLAAGNVDYTPWLDVGTDTSGTPGFQGDFSTLHVDDDSPQVGLVSRIQEGHDLVTASTVIVHEGYYNEITTITKPNVNVLGPQAGVDACEGRTGPEAIIDTSSPVDLSDLGAIVVQADGCTIDGLKFQNNNVAVNVYTTGLPPVAGYNGLNVSNCIVEGAAIDAINLNYHGNVTPALIEGNLIVDVGVSGITAGDDGSTPGVGDDIVTQATIRGNTVLNAQFGITGYQSGSSILGNIVAIDTGLAGAVAASGGVGISGQLSATTIRANTVHGYNNPGGPYSTGIGLATYPNRPESTNVTIRQNSIYNNVIGIGVIHTSGSAVGIVASPGNLIYGNAGAGMLNTTASMINATNNYWGSTSGPLDPVGTNEVPPCNANAALDLNAGATGNQVSDAGYPAAGCSNIDYCPWSDGSGSISMEASDTCIGIGQTQITIQVWSRSVSQSLTGWQAFVNYDTSRLSFNVAASVYSLTPFVSHFRTLGPAGTVETSPGLLSLDGNVGLGGSPDPGGDDLLATLVFDVVPAGWDECDQTMPVFTDIAPSFYTELSLNGIGIPTARIDSPCFTRDTVAPSIACNITEASPISVDANCEAVFNYTALVTDNCGISAANVSRTVTVTTGNASETAPAATITQVDDYTVSVSGSVTVTDLTGCPASVEVTINASDSCANNAASCSDSIDVQDLIAPSISASANDVIVDGLCTASIPFTAVITDNCCLSLGSLDLAVTVDSETNVTAGTPTVATITPDSANQITVTGSVTVSNLTACPASVTLAFNAKDCCGNSAAEETAGADVADNAAPVVTSSNISVPADAGDCTAELLMTASAEDNCAGSTAVTYYANLDMNPDYETPISNPYVFSQGITQVQARSADNCSIEGFSNFTVTVQGINKAKVTVILEGVTVPVTRCISFVPLLSGGPCVENGLINLLNFTDHDSNPATAVRAVDVLVDIPCGDYDAMCAKDEQHTLSDSQNMIVNLTNYEATDEYILLGGDTDDDDDIDINDVTLLLAQFGTLSASGGCPWNGTRDADFSNNGARLSEDYIFLSDNWLEFRNCCAGNGWPLTGQSPGTVPEPLTPLGGQPVPISRYAVDIAELSPSLIAADLNTDGRVDFKDVEQFEVANGLPRVLSVRIRNDEQFAKEAKLKAGSKP